MSSQTPSPESFATCPHCGAANASQSSFCVQCGKALPTGRTGPRVIEGTGMAATAGGKKLQSEGLTKKTRSASGALLAVAILSTLGVALVVFAVQEVINDPEAGGIAKAMIAGQVIMAVAYWGLWIWSRSNPLPAAIIGLVIFLSLILVNAIALGPETIIQGIIVKVIIIIVLIRAIQAGMQHRALLRQSV